MVWQPQPTIRNYRMVQLTRIRCTLCAGQSGHILNQQGFLASCASARPGVYCSCLCKTPDNCSPDVARSGSSHGWQLQPPRREPLFRGALQDPGQLEPRRCKAPHPHQNTSTASRFAARLRLADGLDEAESKPIPAHQLRAGVVLKPQQRHL